MSKPDVLRACCKELRPLVVAIIDAGGSAVATRGDHIQVRLGDQITHIGRTPARGLRNDIQRLRKMLRTAQAVAA